MAKTRKNRRSSSKKSSTTKSTTISPIKPKSIPGESMSSFEREVSTVFLEMLLMVKLFHWKTTSYATHKATDELYEKLNENIDKFVGQIFNVGLSEANISKKELSEEYIQNKVYEDFFKESIEFGDNYKCTLYSIKKELETYIYKNNLRIKCLPF